jgi:AcrR family transcriptional regulator
VYSYFDDKDDLFRQVYVRRANQFMPGLRDVVGRGGSAIDVLGEVVTFQVGFFRRHPHFGRLYLFHSGHVFGADVAPPFDPEIVENFEEAMSLQAAVFVRGQRAGVLRAGDPLVLSRIFSGMVAAYQEMDPAVTSDDPDAAELLPLDELQELVIRAFSKDRSDG